MGRIVGVKGKYPVARKLRSLATPNDASQIGTFDESYLEPGFQVGCSPEQNRAQNAPRNDHNVIAETRHIPINFVEAARKLLDNFADSGRQVVTRL